VALNPELLQTLDVIQSLFAQGNEVNKATNPSSYAGSGSTGFGLGILAAPSGYPTGVYGGFTPYNLEAGARLLAPVITPVRNRMPRTRGKGTAIEFRAITNYNLNSAQSWASEGVSGPMLATGAVKVVFPYKIQSLYNQVSFESQYYGQGQIDAMATATANGLRAFMIAEDNNMLFGNPASGYTGGSAGGSAVSIGGALGTPSALTSANVVFAASGNGNAITNSVYTGTIVNGTYDFRFSAVTGPGQETLVQSADYVVTPSTGPGYFVVQPPVIQGALFYNLYWKVTGDTNYTKLSFTGRVVLTSYTLAGGTVIPSSTGATLPVTGNTDPNTGVAYADYSANANAYAGIFQQLLASGSGATQLNIQRPLNMSNNAFTDLDNLMLNIWNNGQGDPEMLLVNAFESMSITTGTLGAGTPYYVTPGGSQNGATANLRVSRLINKVTGTEIEIITHPRIPQGNMLALSMRLPSWYPGSDISAVFEFNTPVDYQQLAYAVTGPYFPFEIRNWGCVICYLPLVSGVLSGISKG
jgi:hypothetical protein